MASETVDPIDWSHPPPSWAVPPERLVHSINRCNLATAGIRSCNLATFSMWGNHLAHAATQGINHFYRIDDRDNELSRSSNGIIESDSAMTLHCTENLHSCGARTRAAKLQSMTPTTWPSLRFLRLYYEGYTYNNKDTQINS